MSLPSTAQRVEAEREERHQVTWSEGVRSCPLCGKACRMGAGLHSHMRAHRR